MKRCAKVLFLLMIYALAACGLAAPAYGVTCRVVTASVSFGAYNPIPVQPDITTLGTLEVNCDGATTVTISLTVGSGTFANRTLSRGLNSVGYNLYADAGYTQVWGDGTGGTITVSCSFSAPGTQSIPVYGRIRGGQQSATPGTYIATPQIVISWN
jgi:spore coat protein U-like protein